ncbi:efflux RND transporter periplasmic adaptor subunit [Colwellia psychrerythraea]|uniref:Efflux transporter, RND family, MFP subunit n=1 Tax=Colwellia psychrerythraea TaxID=28229 RepID=A0A099L3K1_COLPS|nr:efflux RND transporter periplasmic adaptor subunit [Colwellia psychrerythraea]KGJ96448.1 efflux transporter, RND family, MFP subunit [Colwellia psychrerythraea]
MSRNLEIEQLTIDRGINSSNNYSSRQKIKAAFAFMLLVLVFCSGFVIQAAYLPTNQTDSRGGLQKNSVRTLVTDTAKKISVDSHPKRITQVITQSSVLDASGHIVARRIATVSSRVTGKLNKLNIEEGQRVQRDQIIAELDDKQARISYQLAQADLTANKARFTELLIVHQHELKRLERHLILFNKTLISEQFLDDTRFTTEKVAAQLINKKALIEQSKHKVALAQYQLEQHKIRAPFNGVVISKNAQVGELISSGSSGGGFIRTGVGTIVDMSSLEIEVEVAESFINRVHPNQKAIATLDAYPNWQIPSEVIAVIPTADRQKASIKVRVKLHTQDRKILPDMGVKVSFLGG